MIEFEYICIITAQKGEKLPWKYGNTVVEDNSKLGAKNNWIRVYIRLSFKLFRTHNVKKKN